MKGISEDGGVFDVEVFLFYIKFLYENCEKIDKC